MIIGNLWILLYFSNRHVGEPSLALLYNRPKSDNFVIYQYHPNSP